jgi:hypothetical protein
MPAETPGMSNHVCHPGMGGRGTISPTRASGINQRGASTTPLPGDFSFIVFQGSGPAFEGLDPWLAPGTSPRAQNI